MNPTILIVEDHDAVRASLRDWLSVAFPRCEFLEARSGEEALVQVAAQPFDIVLMDIGLPQMNGIEATRQIKATAPQTRVVMLTIYEEQAFQADAAAVGASAYVAKRKMGTELVPVLTALLAGDGNSGTPGGKRSAGSENGTPASAHSELQHTSASAADDGARGR